MMKTIATVIAVTLTMALVVPPPLVAQVQIEKRRAAPAKGSISIDNSFGSVRVTGWDQQEVLVQGVLAPGSHGLDLDGDQERTHISVHEPDHWFYAPADDTDFHTRLEVFVPVGSHLYVDTVNATIEVSGVRGELDLESVNGSVKLEAYSQLVEVETMTGSVEVTAEGAPMSIESISGNVTLRGVAREAEVDTVSGSVSISGRELAALDVESVTGDVTVRASLAQRGEVDIETFSGPVILFLPPDVRAEFEIETFSGEIASEIGPQKPISERFEPYRTLRFSTGFDEFDIEVSTHEGNVDVRVAADPWSG